MKNIELKIYKNMAKPNNPTDVELKFLKQIAENPGDITSDLVNKFVQEQKIKNKNIPLKKTVKFETNIKGDIVENNNITKNIEKNERVNKDSFDGNNKSKVDLFDENTKNDKPTEAIVVEGNVDVFTFFGMILPKQTVYLFIFFILVAIALYYINTKPKESKKKKLKKNQPNNDDE